MARHLVGAGHQLRLVNRTHDKAERFAALHGGRAFADLVAAAESSDVLITNVPADCAVESVVGTALPALRAGALFIDHSTISARLARRIAADFPGILTVDAPVSGGQAGAEAGRLSVMCGGSAEAIAAAQPVMAAYAARITHIGPAGHGQLAKGANQLAIAGLLQGLAEALSFARRAGLDMGAVIEAVGGGAAQSWQLDNRARTMVEGRFDFGFAVDLMRKDLALALAEARDVGASLPVAALVDQFYAEVQQAGGGRWDTSSLITRLG